MTKTIEELAERCERATGPLRELELGIHETLFGRGYTTNWFQTDGSRVPRYTTSLDAAMTLVPEGASFEVGVSDGLHGASVSFDSDNMPNATIAANPALALCAAALRATLKEESNAT